VTEGVDSPRLWLFSRVSKMGDLQVLGAAGPKLPRVLSHGGSTLESRVGEVEEVETW